MNRKTSLYTIRLIEPDDAVVLLDQIADGLRHEGYGVADYGSTTLSFRAKDDEEALAVAIEATAHIPTTLSTGMGVHRREVTA